MKTARFVGGPYDDKLFAFDSNGPINVAKPVIPVTAFSPDDRTTEGLPSQVPVERGSYDAMGVADEKGNELYRWTGWISPREDS